VLAQLNLEFVRWLVTFEMSLSQTIVATKLRIIPPSGTTLIYLHPSDAVHTHLCGFIVFLEVDDRFDPSSPHHPSFGLGTSANASNINPRYALNCSALFALP